jgi:pimeloyl-ACP methyl ester carboxylesterase
MHKLMTLGMLAGLLCTGLAPVRGAESPAPAHRVRIQGDGPITVVFEAGLGDTLGSWKSVLPRIERRCARVLAYNRAGYAGSPMTPQARDAAHIVGELRAELASRNIGPPYVLVGHSLGGLYMQYFALKYPQEVKGLLLVDPTHAQQLQRIRSQTPGSYRALRIVTSLMAGTSRREFGDSEQAGEQVLAEAVSMAVRTIVLSSTKAAPGESSAFRQLHDDLQREIAARHSAERHEFVPGSGHYIQKDRPQAVIAAARELAGCAAD